VASLTDRLIKRRKEIWDALHPELSDKLSDKGRGRPVSFSSDAEKSTGENQRDVRRHLARAESLGDELDEIVSEVMSCA
jgi:hypothetical protein